MTNKFVVHFLVIIAFFIFTFIPFVVKADKIYKPEIITINGISLYKEAAVIIIQDAEKKDLRITKEEGKVIIVNSKLFNEVKTLYEAALSDESKNNVICNKSIDKEVTVCAKKKERVIILIEIQNEGKEKV